MHLSMGHSSEQAAEVRFHPRPDNRDWEVQIFLGSSFQTLYMSVEEARRFAQDILAVLPVTEPADR
jgi:hypothetical protein